MNILLAITSLLITVFGLWLFRYQFSRPNEDEPELGLFSCFVAIIVTLVGAGSIVYFGLRI